MGRPEAPERQNCETRVGHFVIFKRWPAIEDDMPSNAGLCLELLSPNPIHTSKSPKWFWEATRIRLERITRCSEIARILILNSIPRKQSLRKPVGFVRCGLLIFAALRSVVLPAVWAAKLRKPLNHHANIFFFCADAKQLTRFSRILLLDATLPFPQDDFSEPNRR